jgi:hypothetical protein
MTRINKITKQTRHQRKISDYSIHILSPIVDGNLRLQRCDSHGSNLSFDEYLMLDLDIPKRSDLEQLRITSYNLSTKKFTSVSLSVCQSIVNS